MNAEQALCLLLGGIVIVLGMAFLSQLRPGVIGQAFALSWTCGGIAFALWPPQTCMALDRLTGMVGLGSLAWSYATTLCIASAVTLQAHLFGRWRWWRRSAFAVIVSLGVLYGSMCLWVHVQAGPVATRLFYDGYHGERAAIFVWNMTFGLCSIVVNLLAMRAQLFTPRPQWFDRALVSTFGAGALYSLLIVGQTLASSIGLGSTAVVPLLRTLRLTSIVLVTLVIVWLVVFADVWAAARMWWQTRQLRRHHDHIMALLAIISDRLVWRYAPDQVARLRRLAQQWASTVPDGLTTSQARLALQAARRVAWRRGDLLGQPWDTASSVQRQAAHRSIAEEAAVDIATMTAPMADIGQIICTMLSDVSLPEWLAAPLPPPDDWHIRAAGALAPHLQLRRRSRTKAVRSVPVTTTPTSLPWYRRPARSLQAWYQRVATEHTAMKTNLIVCCELIEDYLTQLNVPDDHDLNVHVAALGDARALSPLEHEIATRSAQIMGLFGLDEIRLNTACQGRVAHVNARFIKPSAPLLSEMKVTLWYTVAAIVTAAMPATHLPSEVVATHELEPHARRLATLIVEAAQLN